MLYFCLWVQQSSSHKKFLSFKALGLEKWRGWKRRLEIEGNEMILPTHQFFSYWSWYPKNWNNLSEFPQQNGDGRPSHSSVIALFLPLVQTVGDAGLGSGGQGDELNSGWYLCLCASCCGEVSREPSWQQRKWRRSRGRKERSQNILFDQILFKNVIYKIHVELWHLPCCRGQVPSPASIYVTWLLSLVWFLFLS